MWTVFRIAARISFVLMSSAAYAAGGVPMTQADGLQITRFQDPPRLVIKANTSTIKVLDGDTFWLSIFKIRLKGIDTLEAKQSCRLDGDVQCSEQIRTELTKILMPGPVRCEMQFDSRGLPAMHHNRYLATCYSGAVEVNLRLVEQGWAFADEKGTVPSYVSAQKTSELSKLGIHKYSPEYPWIFRRRVKSPSKEPVDPIGSFLATPLPTKQSVCKSFCQSQGAD